MIKRPKLGRLTQGTVFCGGLAEDYDDFPVWGLVITARCDTAHEKVTLVNYLPVVRLEDWLLVDGGLALIDRITDNVSNAFRQLLTANELSPSLLDVHDPRDVAALNFSRAPEEDTSKKAQRQNQAVQKAFEFSTALAQLATLSGSPRLASEQLRLILTAHLPIASKLLKELMTFQLAGHYYLPTLGEDTELGSIH